MTDPDLQKNDPAQAGEPVVSKPYIMPDEPDAGSVEALAKEAADARDRVLRTLAEMENLRKRTSREVLIASPAFIILTQLRFVSVIVSKSGILSSILLRYSCAASSGSIPTNYHLLIGSY